MNTGRFVGAAVAVFVVRTLLNFLVYGYLLHGQYEAIGSAHPGLMREVIPAYIVLDLISAVLIVYLVVKAGAAFGGGIKGGVILGILVALLGPVIGGHYNFFSVTYYPANLLAIESIYQIVAHAIQGALAAALYKAA